ncbi:isoprenyl transferase [Clostridia bacterium]|nr:isoprenyl transferase [Clostridia bacterium]
MKTPLHIAIILDGNGRWAKSKGLPRNMGHREGAKNVEVICEAAWDLGVKYLTVYAFSTENWSRPSAEVDALMKLFGHYLKNYLKKAMKNNMRVRIIGERSRLSPALQKAISRLEEETAANSGLNFQIAINYGSRDEMIRAMRVLAQDVTEGKYTPEALDEELFSTYLDTAGIPDPDLLVRTSGEQRISNYLLWQLAYSELYFTDVPWPDFSKEELEKAIFAYNNRDRRYGAIVEEE